MTQLHIEGKHPGENVLYRIDCPLSESSYRATLQVLTYRIMRETPKGCWIDEGGWRRRETPNGWRYVSDHTVKRFAHRTLEGAIASFVARKRRQIQILSAQLEAARLAKRAAEITARDADQMDRLRRMRHLHVDMPMGFCDD